MACEEILICKNAVVKYVLKTKPLSEELNPLCNISSLCDLACQVRMKLKFAITHSGLPQNPGNHLTWSTRFKSYESKVNKEWMNTHRSGTSIIF